MAPDLVPGSLSALRPLPLRLDMAFCAAACRARLRRPLDLRPRIAARERALSFVLRVAAPTSAGRRADSTCPARRFLQVARCCRALVFAAGICVILLAAPDGLHSYQTARICNMNTDYSHCEIWRINSLDFLKACNFLMDIQAVSQNLGVNHRKVTRTSRRKLAGHTALACQTNPASEYIGPAADAFGSICARVRSVPFFGNRL
jgi:hypothetical protein